jgi:outer membrane biogenesis lipoprotein LolB
MKKLLVLLAVAVLAGCASYEKPGADVSEEQFALRECEQQVKGYATYPTKAEAFVPCGLELVSARIDKLTDSCMAKNGFKRVAKK